MITKRTARKQHTCTHCLQTINVGDSYFHEGRRVPRYNSMFENQVGIKYVNWKYCQVCKDSISHDLSEFIGITTDGELVY